jgi:signal peptidase I
VSPQAADRSVEITPRVAAAQTLATVVIVEALRAGKSIPLRITGRSMYPFLSSGEVVLLEPCPVQSLETGDLVAFERDYRVILHRVLAIHPGKVIEKGDNVRQETVVEERQIIGRARAILGQRTVSLMQPRYRTAARWLARLSALHGRIHWFAAHRCRGLRPLARAFTLLVRLTAKVVRPAL